MENKEEKYPMGLGYEIKRLVIDKDNINKLTYDSEIRRQERSAQVNKIYNGLEKGKHFDSPIVVERRNNKYIVIDGNHRVLAINKFLEKHPEETIEILLLCYDGPLTVLQRRKLYTKHNMGIKQTTDDFVCAYRGDISTFRRTETELPVTIYPRKNSIKYRNLMGAYIGSIQKGTFNGGYGPSPKEFVDRCKELTDEDIDIICEFWNWFDNTFGVTIIPDEISKHREIKTSPFNCIFRLWYVNIKKGDLTEREATRRFRRKNVVKIINDYSYLGGRESCLVCMDVLVKALNKQVRIPKNQFYHEYKA